MVIKGEYKRNTEDFPRVGWVVFDWGGRDGKLPQEMAPGHAMALHPGGRRGVLDRALRAPKVSV